MSVQFRQVRRALFTVVLETGFSASFAAMPAGAEIEPAKSPLACIKVVSNAPRDVTPRSVASLQCLAGAERPPEYPRSSIDRIETGTLVARYRFVAAGEPPTVEILFDAGSERFGRVVRNYAAGFDWGNRSPAMVLTRSSAPTRTEASSSPGCAVSISSCQPNCRIRSSATRRRSRCRAVSST